MSSDNSELFNFQELEMKEHVTVLPSYLGKIGVWVTAELSSRVLQYHEVYGGVLLAYSHIRIVNSTGHIIDELPHIHINIEYTATVFQPQVGMVMCGHVNRVGVDHIGCLLFNCFNVSVTCSADSETDDNDWCKEQRVSSWCSRSFASGEKMWFTISRVEITGRLLALRGEYILEEENIEDVTCSDRSKVKKPKRKTKRKKENIDKDKKKKPRSMVGEDGV